MKPLTGTGETAARLHHVDRGALSAATAQSSGMRRFAAISGEMNGARRIWMGESHLHPGVDSGPHHHGDSETGIYVVSGNPVFIYRDGADEVRLRTQPGDYVFVPAHVPHVESNRDSPVEAVVVLARSTQEAIVVNLDHL